MSYLSEYEEIDGGYVAFGRDPKGGKITSKGKISTGKLDFKDVYFVKELKFNLFSVLQIVPRKNNMYSVDLRNVAPSGGLNCLLAKATLDESNLWHRRLGHISFKTMNKLKGKQHKASWNQTNGNAYTKENINAGQAKKKTVYGPQYVLLPLLTSDSQGPKSSEDEVAEKKSTEVTRKDNKVQDLAKEGDKNNQEKDVKDQEEALRKQFKQESERLFGQGEAANTNSTNILNTVSSPVNVVSSSFTTVDPGRERTQRNKFENLPTDPLMPDLEDTADTRIFSGVYDDEVKGAMTDFNNLELTIVKESSRKGQNQIKTGQKREAIEAIMLFLAYASFIGFIVYQMVVKSTFLYGIIEEEVYVCQPPGFEDPHFPNKVYKVEKALYGLHQAPKAWYEKLSTYLLENGFRRGIIDKTLFIKKDKSDILINAQKFQMSSMGELTFFLGLQVMQRDDGIFISQDKYMADILKKFDFSSIKTTSTPIETNKALLKDKEVVNVDVHLYRSMIGSLMYLTASRLDIMFVVCACARFQVKPKVSHLHDVKRIYRYLKGQPKLGLWYPTDLPFDLEVFSDSDYTGASLDRKSIIGGCQFLDGKKIIIAEASIRRDLQLQDAKGTACLPNDIIFEELARMGHPISSKVVGSQFSWFKKIVEVEEMDYPVVKGVKEACEEAGVVGGKRSSRCYSRFKFRNGGKGLVRLAILVPGKKQKLRRKQRKVTEVPHTEPQTKESVPTTSNDPLPSDEDRMQLTELMNFCTNLQKQVLNLEKSKTAQAKEIIDLKKRVKKLERKKKSRTSEITLVDETQGRMNEEEMFGVNDLFGDEVIMDATAGEEVMQSTKVAEKEVSTADPVTTTAITPQISKDELTLAQNLIEIKVANPRQKGL
nr:putative ribonuclease H-like domain-containing protein [Tanacetum cinerariifolium]